MAHSLDGARFKVVRAQEHLDTLKIEIAKYLDGNPWVIRTEENKDALLGVSNTFSLTGQPKGSERFPPGTGFAPSKSGLPPYHAFVDITNHPPLQLSAIIGDCVTNVRASLDYIMWELASRYFSPPIDITKHHDRNITAFPITNNPKDVGHVNRLNCLTNRKIPAAAIAEIKAVQPYNRGYEPLWWLHGLVNGDKHRMPVLTIAEVPSFIYGVGPDGSITYNGGPVGRSVTFKGHVEALDTVTNGGLIETKTTMEMDNQITVTVTFQDVTMPREPVDRTLEQIIKTAADIIPRFDQFFV